MSDFFKLFFWFSIFQTIVGTSVFFSRASGSFVSSAAGLRHFLRVCRNQKPRMKGLCWHPGYFQTAVIKKSASIWDEKATPVTLFCNISSELLPSDKLASLIPGEQFVFYPANVLLPLSLSTLTCTKAFYFVFYIYLFKKSKKVVHYYHWQKKSESAGNRSGIKSVNLLVLLARAIRKRFS